MQEDQQIEDDYLWEADVAALEDAGGGLGGQVDDYLGLNDVLSLECVDCEHDSGLILGLDTCESEEFLGMCGMCDINALNTFAALGESEEEDDSEDGQPEASSLRAN